MKKTKYLLAALLIGAIAFTGCGDKKEEENNEELEASRKATAEDAAYGLRKAAQLYYTEKLLESMEAFKTTTFNCDGKSCSDKDNNKLDILGTVPTSGKITIMDDGSIKSENIVINDFKCTFPDAVSVTCSK